MNKAKSSTMKASTLGFRIAVLCAAIGMIIGLMMAASHNHAVMPAHAHLNLLGWVSLFLFSIFYKLHPVADTTLIAKIQVMVWTFGAVVMATGVGLIYTGRTIGEPLAGIGSIATLIGLALFIRVVYVETSAVKVTRQPELISSSMIIENEVA